MIKEALIKKLEGEISSEDYQNIVYKVGKEVFPNDLRQWFISLYQILLVQTVDQDWVLFLMCMAEAMYYFF